MNILGYAPQMASYGGMERHVCGLSAALASSGHRVELLTTSNSLGAEFRSLLLSSGVKFRELPLRREQALNASQGVRKALWLLSEVIRARRTQWDIIYTNGQSALSRIAWLAGRRGTRRIHHHHTAADKSEQATWSPSFRRVLATAPELVACSRATRDSLASALGRSDVTFLPYLAGCPVEAEAVHDRAYNAGSPLQFGFAGRLVREKGIGSILELSRRPELASVRWHLHGSGADYPPEPMAAYPNVHYHGAWTERSAQAAALLALDALVLFSQHNEGMPLSLIEAMSAGLPWVATDRGGTGELAISGPNCLLLSGAPDLGALSTAVLQMAARLRRGATSRTAQRRVYDAHFSPKAVSAAWRGYFEQPKRGGV